MSAPTKTLFYYRMQHGRKVRWRLVLDAQNLMVDHGPADDIRSQVPVSQLHTTDARSTAYLNEMQRRGNVLTVEGNDVHIQRPGELELQIVRFFSDSTPCFFPGCQELRQRWHEFVSPNLDPNGVCPDCVLGQLMTQFRTEHGLEQVLREWTARQPAT